jgi:hypothetical protein
MYGLHIVSSFVVCHDLFSCRSEDLFLQHHLGEGLLGMEILFLSDWGL